MKIACLGWGSLIWDPRTLPLMPNKPRWFTDGPELPIEFARQSSCGRITLVIVRPENTRLQRVLWAYLTSPSMAAAHEALAQREWGDDPPPRNWENWKERNIASWPQPAGSSSAHIQQIAAWANTKGLDGVVWTILQPKFDNVGSMPTSAQVLNYLRTRTGRELQNAEAYIRKAPPQIQTDYRAAIEKQLGWTCDPPGPNTHLQPQERIWRQRKVPVRLLPSGPRPTSH
jgi:hypothetical protein